VGLEYETNSMKTRFLPKQAAERFRAKPSYLQCYHYLAVPKGDSNVPSRRASREPLREKVFSYYTKRERQLLEQAANLESRSLSSFVALAALERARRILGRS